MSDMTLNLNPTTDAEYQAAIELMLAEINRKHEEMVRSQQAIEASQARTDLIMQDIQRMLFNRRREANC